LRLETEFYVFCFPEGKRDTKLLEIESGHTLRPINLQEGEGYRVCLCWWHCLGYFWGGAGGLSQWGKGGGRTFQYTEQEKITVKEHNAHIIFKRIGFSPPFSRQLKYTSFNCYTEKRKTKREVRTGGWLC